MSLASPLTAVKAGQIIEGMGRVDEAAQIDEVIARLNVRYQDVHPGDVTKLVNDELARFSGCRIREFVPLFVERSTRAKLSTMEPVLNWSS